MAKRFIPRSNASKIPIIFKDKTFDMSVTYPKGSYRQSDFDSRIGQWISFKTPWGNYQGIVEQVDKDAVLIKLPSKYAKTKLVGYLTSENHDMTLAGEFCGVDGFKQGPWCWCWFPIIIIIFIFPFFCW